MKFSHVLTFCSSMVVFLNLSSSVQGGIGVLIATGGVTTAVVHRMDHNAFKSNKREAILLYKAAKKRNFAKVNIRRGLQSVPAPPSS